MNKFVNKLVKVITIYGEEIIGVVIQKPILVLHLKKIDGTILVIDIDDIDDIILIGDVDGEDVDEL